MVCDVFFLYATPTQLGNSNSLKKAWCLGIIYGYRSWERAKIMRSGQEDRHKEPLRPRLMLCHFYTNFTKKPLWDWVVALCQKEAFVVPQQGHSFEGKVLIHCSSHLPPWLHTIFLCTAWATQCGKHSMVRKYAQRRVCDCKRSWK